MSEWTDEVREQVIEAYKKADPTPENSVEIVKELAEEFDKTPNGVRMILTKADVYVKRAPAQGSSSSNGGASKSTRVSKADAMAKLTTAIEAAGQEPNEEIISKLTGKAALYFAEVIENCAD